MRSSDSIYVTEQLRELMAEVTFAPSCLDMGWEWEVREVACGWLIRCSFQRPDTHTGEIGTGFGRWWVIEPGTTVSGVVKTMWAGCKMIVEHELHEAYLYKGRRVFDRS